MIRASNNNPSLYNLVFPFYSGDVICKKNVVADLAERSKSPMKHTFSIISSTKTKIKKSGIMWFVNHLNADLLVFWY